MKIWNAPTMTLLLVMSLAFAVACGDDDDDPPENQNQSQTENQNQSNQNNQNNQNNQPDNTSPGENENTHQGEPGPPCSEFQDAIDPPRDSDGYDGSGVSLMSDYELLFSAFAFTSESPGAALNPIIVNFLDQSRSFPIIVLLDIEGLDAGSGEIMVRGGAGLHADEPGGGEYEFDMEFGEPDGTAGSIDNEGWFEARLDLFNFVASMQVDGAVDKALLPIRELDIDAQLRAEADGTDPHIVDGSAYGVVLLEDIKDTEIVINPSEGTALPLRNALGVDEMNCDYSGDGFVDAWFLSATFSAEETVIVD